MRSHWYYWAMLKYKNWKNLWNSFGEKANSQKILNLRFPIFIEIWIYWNWAALVFSQYKFWKKANSQKILNLRFPIFIEIWIYWNWAALIFSQYNALPLCNRLSLLKQFFSYVFDWQTYMPPYIWASGQYLPYVLLSIKCHSNMRTILIWHKNEMTSNLEKAQL